MPTATAPPVTVPLYTRPAVTGRPLGTGKPPGTGRPNGTGRPRPPINDTKPLECGCTISAVDATVAWWFSDSFYYGISTMKSAYDSNSHFIGYTADPATTTFDVAEALATNTYIPTFVWDPAVNSTVFSVIVSSVSDPPAATTSVLSVTGVKPLPTGVIDVDTANNAWVDPWPSPSVVIPGPANKTVFSA